MRRHLIHRRRTIEEPNIRITEPIIGLQHKPVETTRRQRHLNIVETIHQRHRINPRPASNRRHMTLQRMLVTKQLQRRILRPTHPQPPTQLHTRRQRRLDIRHHRPNIVTLPQHLSDTVNILRRRHIHPTQHIRTKPRQPARLTPQRPSIEIDTHRRHPKTAPENLHIPQRIRMPRMINKQHLTVGHNTPH